MELYTMRYVLAVAELGSFSLASQACHVGQPALSQQVERLENQTIITGVPGQRIWEDTQSLQRKYAIKGIRFISSQSLDTSISMAACGMGVFTLSPFYIINSQAVQRDDLFYFILDDPLFQWTLAVRCRSKSLSEPERRIIALIRETFCMDEGTV